MIRIMLNLLNSLRLKPTKKLGLIGFFKYWVLVFLEGDLLALAGFVLILIVVVPIYAIATLFRIALPGSEVFMSLAVFPGIAFKLLLLFLYQYTVFYDPAHPEKYAIITLTRQKVLGNFVELFFIIGVWVVFGLILSLIGIRGSEWVIVPIPFFAYREIRQRLTPLGIQSS